MHNNGHFVALCEYPSSEYPTAHHTMERMGSFSYGASLAVDKAVSLREFGSWIYHYALTIDYAALAALEEGR